MTLRYCTKAATRAFTLIEILIVVVILGILAAIVIPQFTNASDDAQQSSVQSQLQTVRGQIELYNVQQGAYPDFATTGWADMLLAPDGTTRYLQAEPRNPRFNNMTGVVTGVLVPGDPSGADPATEGWVWNTATNIMYAVDTDGSVYNW